MIEKYHWESTKYRMVCTRWHDIHKNPTTYAPGISQHLPLLRFAVDLPVIFTMLVTRWSTMYCTWRIIPSSKWLVTPHLYANYTIEGDPAYLHDLLNISTLPFTNWDDPPSTHGFCWKTFFPTTITTANHPKDRFCLHRKDHPRHFV